MITNRGKQALLEFMSGQVSEFGACLAIGVGDTAATANDIKLNAEVNRQIITSRSPVFTDGKVIFKATLPEGEVINVREIGVVSGADDEGETSVVEFVSDNNWTGGTRVAEQARFGTHTQRVIPAASGTSTMNVGSQFSVDANSDVVLNYFAGSSLSSGFVRLRMENTAVYFQHALTVTPGYHSVTIPRTSFSKTGDADWDIINDIYVSVTATGDAGRQFYFDALMIREQSEGDLLARRVLPAPVVKPEGVEVDVEYVLDIA